uniref:Uncharacterized protein n=1 Tax=Oryza glumipatula TaxID=40148 RepID=A0A0D9YRX8_9ORYZ
MGNIRGGDAKVTGSGYAFGRGNLLGGIVEDLYKTKYSDQRSEKSENKTALENMETKGIFRKTCNPIPVLHPTKT